MQYAVVFDPANAAAAYISSAEPDDLESRVNAYIAALTTGTVITGIELTGSGDGHMFTCLIESVPPQELQPISTGGLVALGCRVRCYMGSTPDALDRARAAVVAPATSQLVDDLLAGADQGQRVMGMIVYGSNSFPNTQIPALGMLGGTNLGFVLAQGDNIITTGFGLTGGILFVSPADGRLRYIGTRPIFAITDVHASVSVDDAAAVVGVGAVTDPAGTPALLGTEAQAVPGTTTMAISQHAAVTLSPNDEVGVRVQVAAPGSAGTVLSAILRVVQVGGG